MQVEVSSKLYSYECIRDLLIGKLFNLFPICPFQGHITLPPLECDEDYRAIIAINREFSGKAWNEIQHKALTENWLALIHMTDSAICYFLPSYLKFCFLQPYEAKCIFSCIISILDVSPEGNLSQACRSLSPKQRELLLNGIYYIWPAIAEGQLHDIERATTALKRMSKKIEGGLGN